MNVAQISELLNDVTPMALGEEAVSVVDLSSLVALGNVVLKSNESTDLWLKTLTLRIGKTILSWRKYRNKLEDMVLDDFEYGAILQKISIHLIPAQDDPSAELTDGETVDHYKINNPDVEQKLFCSQTPYMFVVTIQDAWLNEAFLSFEKMGAFISYVFGRVRDSIEFSLENLGRMCLCNFAVETENVVNLVSLYNAETGETLDENTCLHSSKFLAFAVAIMNEYSDKLTDMSTTYNDGSMERHTPYEDQRFRTLSTFRRRLETVVQYEAFHDNFVTPDRKADYLRTLNYWQGEKSPMKIVVKRASDGEEVTINNVIAMLYDREALGIYKKTEKVVNTPINAFGLFYNQAVHEKQLWFNDLSENYILFTLN